MTGWKLNLLKNIPAQHFAVTFLDPKSIIPKPTCMQPESLPTSFKKLLTQKN
jgi:hypothetical protein